MDLAARSLALPAGFRYSSLAYISAPGNRRFSFKSGVLPISASALCTTDMKIPPLRPSIIAEKRRLRNGAFCGMLGRMNIVIVAEKPSVGRDIARVLGASQRGDGCLMGKGYIVTWALGHLVSLMEPDELDERYRRWRMDDLPILPEDIPLKVLPATRSQFAIVKKLMNDKDTAEVICATDAAREGELIFRYIYRMAGCKKPVRRLWISSMTDAAIRKGFEELRPAADYDALYESARCRSLADWLVGMNASRRLHAALRGAFAHGPRADANAGAAGKARPRDRRVRSPGLLGSARRLWRLRGPLL